MTAAQTPLQMLGAAAGPAVQMEAGAPGYGDVLAVLRDLQKTPQWDTEDELRAATLELHTGLPYLRNLEDLNTLPEAMWEQVVAEAAADAERRAEAGDGDCSEGGHLLFAAAWGAG